MIRPDVTARMDDIDELDRALSEPSDEAIRTLADLPGDIVILGVAGKMGPTLAWMARKAADRAGHARRIIGVARFSDRSLQPWLEARGIDTVSADLLDRQAVLALPDAPLVIYMAGRKFGSSGQESLTWAMNAAVPVLVAERYAGSRIAAFSTGNVYGLVPVASGGSRETDPLRPVGEYAMSCVGRERIFQHYAGASSTPTVLLRLNYATEMRYGLLVDLAQKIRSGEPIDLTMGYMNVIWQGDANAMALASLAVASSPAIVVNVAGPGPVRVRDVATALADRMGIPVHFTGTEAADALLSDGHVGWQLLGAPRVPLQELVAWTADWVSRGGETSHKPTHFESRDGRF
jgi:nucleoside-diphosphate-sugar epimerase